MNTKTIVAGVIFIIVVALGIWLIASPKSQTEGDSAVQQADQATVAGTKPGVVPNNPNTFTKIFSQAGSHECKYNAIDKTSKSSNVIYIADGKMRGEFRTDYGGTSDATLVVFDGSLLYTWKEGTTVGTKAPLKSVSQLPVAIPADLTSGAIYGTSDNNVSWDCHDWIKNKALLVPPTYVKFSA